MRKFIFALLPSFLRILILRLQGHKIGKRVKIWPLAVLDAEEIILGDDCVILPFSRILAQTFTMGHRCKIGFSSKVSALRVVLGHECSIGKFVTVGGRRLPNSALIMGDRCVIYNHCYVDTTDRVQLDDEACIGASSFLFTHACGHASSVLEGFPRKIAPVHIKTRAWVPWHVFIMPGVTIGEFSIVSSGSVVGMDIPDYALAAGSPCRIVSTNGNHLERRTEVEKKAMVQAILDDFCENENGHSSVDCRKKIVFLVDSNVIHDAVDVVISWVAFSEEKMRDLEQSKTSWFDVERRRCSWCLNALGVRIRDQFSWYGILFAPSTIEVALTERPEPIAHPTRADRDIQ